MDTMKMIGTVGFIATLIGVFYAGNRSYRMARKWEKETPARDRVRLAREKNFGLYRVERQVSLGNWEPTGGVTFDIKEAEKLKEIEITQIEYNAKKESNDELWEEV